MRWWGLAIALVFLSIWLRVFIESREELQAAQSAEAAGELVTALEHYQYAARWYSPFASAPGDALDALQRIGEDARDRGLSDLSLKAFRRLRGAILATRWLVRPGVDRLDTVNRNIAELMAEEQWQRADATVRGRSKDELAQEHLELLSLDALPSPVWSLW